MSVLRVRRFSIPAGELTNQHTWPLKVVTESLSPDFPAEVFVYNASDGDDKYMGDVFEAVASVHQLYELGTSPGSLGDDVKMTQYRRDTMEFHCRSEQEYMELWDHVKNDLQDLVNNYHSAQQLKEEEVLEL